MVNKISKTKRAKIGINVLSVLKGEFEVQESEDGDNFVRYGDKIAIRVCNGEFWQTKIYDNNIVSGEGKSIDAWELFKIVAFDAEFASNKGDVIRYGDKIALFSLINTQFVGADQDGQGQLTARVPWVKAWEIFHIICPPDRKQPVDKIIRYGSWFALESSNGKYVSFDRDGSKLLSASVDWIRDWECFVIINPTDFA
jgi:hypothetical protein